MNFPQPVRHIPESSHSRSNPRSSTKYTHAYGCTPTLPLTGGWARYVHINGGVYFYHAEYRIITERNVASQSDQEDVLEDWKEFLEISQENGMIRFVTPDADVVLRYLLSDSDSGEEEDTEELELAEAFFVCYSNASEVKCPRVGQENITVQHDTYAYWTHIEEYPMHIREQRDVVLHKAITCFWSSIAFLSDARSFEMNEFILPFTVQQINRVVEVYEDLSDVCETHPAMIPMLIWYLARMIREVKAMQEGVAMAVGYHSGTEIQGQSGYAIKHLSSAIHRAIRGDTGVTDKNDWSLAVADLLFSSILLFTNRAYRTRLAQTRVAWSVNLEEFRNIIGKMLTEWTDTNLVATVFVGANVSFLSIPSITALQRTACLASAMFSVVSIGSGLYHVWHHRTKVSADSVEATKYVYHVQGPRGKGESDMSDPFVMSLFLAIPAASLLWAVLCFVFAVFAFCVQSSGSHGRLFLSVAMTVGVFVFGLMVTIIQRFGGRNASFGCRHQQSPA